MDQLRIAECRKLLGLSQEELAAKLNISQKSISKYERGDRRPTYETLVAMANLFDVSVDYLLGRTDDKHRNSPSDDKGFFFFFFLSTSFWSPSSYTKLVSPLSETAWISVTISSIVMVYLLKPYASNFFTNRVALCPPKPRELEIAQFTSICTPSPLQ